MLVILAFPLKVFWTYTCHHIKCVLHCNACTNIRVYKKIIDSIVGHCSATKWVFDASSAFQAYLELLPDFLPTGCRSCARWGWGCGWGGPGRWSTAGRCWLCSSWSGSTPARIGGRAGGALGGSCSTGSRSKSPPSCSVRCSRGEWGTAAPRQGSPARWCSCSAGCRPPRTGRWCSSHCRCSRAGGWLGEHLVGMPASPLILNNRAKPASRLTFQKRVSSLSLIVVTRSLHVTLGHVSLVVPVSVSGWVHLRATTVQVGRSGLDSGAQVSPNRFLPPESERNLVPARSNLNWPADHRHHCAANTKYKKYKYKYKYKYAIISTDPLTTTGQLTLSQKLNCE